MRKIAGDLGLVSVANILQLLSMSQAQGFLTILMGSEKKVIHLSTEGIRLVSGVRRTNPLGEILLRTGKITSAQLQDLLAENRRTGKRLGDVVADRGILSQEAIDQALREQAAEEIYDLFTWTEATFEFVEAELGAGSGEDGPLATVILDANVMSIMIEAARRIDELTRIRQVISDERLVPQQLELPAAAVDDPGIDRNALEEILPLIDGERSIGHIIEESLYPKFTVLRTLYGLALRGVIKIRAQQSEDRKSITVIYRSPPAPVEGTPPRKTRTILLLSELVTFRNALAYCIRSAGFDVLEGAAWDRSMETLCRECISAVVVDLSIETEDGLSLCTRLREATPTPFIVLAGNTSRQAVANALRSGAHYVLVKPINESLLVERLTSLFPSEDTRVNRVKA